MLRVGTKLYPNTAKDKVEALTTADKPEPVSKPKPTKKVKADA